MDKWHNGKHWLRQTTDEANLSKSYFQIASIKHTLIYGSLMIIIVLMMLGLIKLLVIGFQS